MMYPQFHDWKDSAFTYTLPIRAALLVSRKAGSSHGPVGIAHLSKLRASSLESAEVVVRFDGMIGFTADADIRNIVNIVLKTRQSFMVYSNGQLGRAEYPLP